MTLLDTTSLKRLHREEVRELGRIYRRTASDLAIARAESRDPRLINYLNSLVIRAHGASIVLTHKEASAFGISLRVSFLEPSERPGDTPLFHLPFLLCSVS